MTFGYARVSTDEQTTSAQRAALELAGVEPARIFEDVASGAGRRPQLDIAITQLLVGDTLIVWRLDRLGRSLPDLLDIAARLRSRGVALRSLTEHIDTSTAAGAMLYAVLGAVAQFERDVMRERTVAAIAQKRRRGEPIGRPRALTPAQVVAARKMLDTGDSPSYVARVLRVGRSTLYASLGRAVGAAFVASEGALK